MTTESKPSWPPKIDPAAFERARKAQERAEQKERERFPDGKPFPIPDHDDE